MKRALSFLILFCVSVWTVGQTSCYNENRSRGISLFNGGKYSEAIKVFTVAKSCPDKPSSNDLDTWIKKCDDAIAEKKRKEEERKRKEERERILEERNAYFSISPSNVEIDANGGSKTFTISCSRTWAIGTNTYSWGHLTRQGNTLTLRVDANTSSSSRTDYFTIKSGSKTLRVNISQKGKSIIENSSSRNSFICIYDGGYFIRDGTQWYEYRPQSKPNTYWANYSQTKEDDNYYYIKSSASDVCVPKSSINKVYIYRNNQWEVVYNTTQVFQFCPQRGNKLFCHTTGFFFKDGNNWKEYRPSKNSNSAWASYEQTSFDDGFYYIKSTQCEVAVPRKSTNKFFIKKPSENKWEEVYTTTQVFDY